MKMKGRLILLLLCLFIKGYSKDILVNLNANVDCRITLQNAVNSALVGDRLVLPRGSFYLTGTVNINKKISIKGQGKNWTFLHRYESTPDADLYNIAMFKINIPGFTNSNVVISDLSFNSKSPSLYEGDGGSKAIDKGIEIIGAYNFLIKECNFNFFGNAAVYVVHNDSIVGGLITECQFNFNTKGFDGMGYGYGVAIYGENKKWVKDPKFGSSNFIFVENNWFNFHRHSIAAGGCGLYVFRYNKVYDNVLGNAAHAIDAHDARLNGGSNHYSTRAIEVYNNEIINNLFKCGAPTGVVCGTEIVSGKPANWIVECAIRPRGGEAVIHDNYIQGYRFGVGPIVTPLGYSYPVPYQVGYQDADLYAWGDTFIPYARTSQHTYFYNYSPNYLVNQRDYFLTPKPNYTPYIYPHPLNN